MPSAEPALDFEDRLIELAASCRHDPLRFVKAAYPWGERGGPLERYPGPDRWQTEVLSYIRGRVDLGDLDVERSDPTTARH